MKPIWIVDDDQSIRCVLEKALAREELAVRSFTNRARRAARRSTTTSRRCWCPTSACRAARASSCCSKVKERHPRPAGHHHDRVLRPRQRGRARSRAAPSNTCPSRSTSTKAVELIRRARRRKPARGSAPTTRRVARRPRCSARRRRCRTCSARSAGCRRRNVDGADHRRIGHRQGAGRARAAQAQPARAAARSSRSTPRRSRRTCSNRELFGHERGAFTGAQTMRRGRFEQAEGGTLFLDEIGDMPFDLQTRLLRVLSDGAVLPRRRPQRRCKANVRVIAATHQNLEERVRQGLFREDLFHRLNVDPPAPAGAARAARGHPAAGAPLPAEERARARRRAQAHHRRGARSCCRGFDFPGNVRQLENICHWLTVMAPGQRIDVARPAARSARAQPAPAASRRSATGSRRSTASSRRRWRAASATSATGWSANSSAR